MVKFVLSVDMKTQIKLHGILGQQLGKNLWNLAVNSVGEAVHAIEILSGRRFYKLLLDNDKKGIRYRVLINGRDFKSNQSLSLEDIDSIKTSELALNIRNLKSIDVVPVLQGAGDVLDAFMMVLGVILMIVGVLTSPFGVGAAIFMAGLALVAGGIINLLSRPPKFEDFREIQNSGKKASYLFNGPENIEKEGGPVPVGYGRLTVGSQVISTSYTIDDKQISDQGYISS